jgi:hypothetical protein
LHSKLVAFPRGKVYVHITFTHVKGIVSIILLENGWKKIAEKTIIRSNNYDVCTAASLCISNILHVVVLQNILLSSDPKYEMVGKILHYSLCIMMSQCKMTSLCRSQCKMMSLCAVSSRGLKKRYLRWADLFFKYFHI